MAVDGYDAVVVHDPAALGALRRRRAPAVWQLPLDCSRPDAPAWERAAPLAERCAAVWAPASSFAPPGIEAQALPPGIDPLSPRNLDLAPRLAGRVLRQLGVDLTRPFVCQLMRMDRWKDPHATLEAFALAREELPRPPARAGGGARAGRAEAWPAVKEVTDYAGGQEDVLVLTSYSGVGNLELGALQRLARVCLLRALREGFGLAASEALWKATPVIGGHERRRAAPGARRDRRLPDGHARGDGRADRRAGARPGPRDRDGQAGRERVRERFLVTRALEDELRLLGTVMSG